LRDTDVLEAGIVTDYGLDDRGVGVRVSVGSRIFSSPRRPDLLWGPPSLLVPGALSPGVKRQGRETDHSPTTSAEVKKMWIYISTPPIRLHGVVKHRDNFTDVLTETNAWNLYDHVE
jgi:hypothetical protein